jgi:hypothetical protein
MAKDFDNLARSLDTEDAGGALTGFLAEEDQFDRRSLWRLGSWGVGAVGAVIVAVLANQSAISLRREQVASADLVRQSQQIQSVAKESQHETRRLASAIDTLNGDRDRLYSRLTVLEQGLDSVTGSIARQNAAAATAPSSPVVTSSPASASVVPAAMASSAPASPAKAEPLPSQSAAPAVAPVVSAAAAKAKDVAVPDKPPAAVAAAPEPVPAIAASTGQMASNAPAATPATPLMPAKSIMAPPDAAAGKLVARDVPPDNGAAAPPPEVIVAAASTDDGRTDDKADDKTDAAAATSTLQRTEFAVDVGTANSVPGLRALWRGLLKSKSNTALAGLRPIIVVKEGNNGVGMQLRLVAGPLSDAAAAAKICAVLLEHKRATCETTVFDGQQLAVKDDEPPAAAKPVPVHPSAHRRSVARRVMVDEPPRPQPTTLSSFFSR